MEGDLSTKLTGESPTASSMIKSIGRCHISAFRPKQSQWRHPLYRCPKVKGLMSATSQPQHLDSQSPFELRTSNNRTSTDHLSPAPAYLFLALDRIWVSMPLTAGEVDSLCLIRLLWNRPHCRDSFRFIFNNFLALSAFDCLHTS